MTQIPRLSDQLIAERRVEEYRENVQDGLQSMTDSARFRRVACRAYVGICGVLELTGPEAAKLLGMPTAEHRHWIADEGWPMSPDTLDKISCLLGMYRYLGSLYSGHTDRMVRWVKTSNVGFDNKSPYDVLAGAPPSVFRRVRRAVAALTT